MIFTPCGLPLIFSRNSIPTEGKERYRPWVPPMGLFTIGITSAMATWGAVVALIGGLVYRGTDQRAVSRWLLGN